MMPQKPGPPSLGLRKHPSGYFPSLWVILCPQTAGNAPHQETEMKTAQKTASHSCGAVWHQIASRAGHCCTCHQTFSSEQVFDAHRTPDGPTPCIDPATLLNKAGQPRFETFTDLAGCEVWRSTTRRPVGSWSKKVAENMPEKIPAR